MGKQDKSVPGDKFLITGATGFIGANLARYLVKNGFNVYTITRKISGSWRIKEILNQLHQYQVDIQDVAGLKRVIKRIQPDIIFHLANAGLYQGMSVLPRDLIQVNLMGTVNLIEAAADISYRCLVNTGSSAEYGPKQKPMKETDLCQPTTSYGLSKLTATLYGNLVSKSTGKPIVSLRLFSPFGPYDDPRRLITYSIIQALKNKPLFLGSREAVRDFVFIEDVIDAYLMVIDNVLDSKGEIFNIGSGHQISVGQVVDKILKYTGSKSKIKWQTTNPYPQESPKWQADIKKARAYFSWNPKFTFDEGLIKTISWFRNNLYLYN